jgi:CDP-diglyceride synthetase
VIFPILEALHVMALALSVGAIAIVDLWALGFGSREDHTARQLRRWTPLGLALILATGAALFLMNVGRYIHNLGFLIKMALLVAALAVHFTVHRKQRPSRGAAILSLTLWSAVVIAAKFIADLDA